MLDSTLIWWILQVFILLTFFISRKYFFIKADFKNMNLIIWYLSWNLFCIVRGAFIAENYWDWKNLMSSTFALLFPIVAYAALNISIFQSILSFFIKYVLPLFFAFAFLMVKGAWGFFLVPISFILLFLPVLKLRWKLIMVAFALTVILADFSARSNVIKFGIPILLSLIYYFRQLLSNKIYELIRILLFISPFIFLGLAISGVFNVFDMEDYAEGDYVQLKQDADGQIVEESLTADTRTFLYVEVLQTAQKYNSWWIGRSPARGNESESFGEDDPSHRGERHSNEAAILNIFTWTGIIGVFLFFLIFYKASSLAVNHSNNIFSKSLGLFIAFHWMYSWVENGNFLNLSSFIIWLMIGVCFSSSFRTLTNEEVKIWIWGIFEKKHAIGYII